MRNFENPKWSFRYRGWVNLLDLRETLRSQETPTGLGRCARRSDLRGRQIQRHRKLRGLGHHARLTCRSSMLRVFQPRRRAIDNKGLVVNNFLAEAFGGTVKGRITLRFDGLFFRAETRIEGAQLGGVFPAIEAPRFSGRRTALGYAFVGRHRGNLERRLRAFDISAKVQWNSPEDIA